MQATDLLVKISLLRLQPFLLSLLSDCNVFNLLAAVCCDDYFSHCIAHVLDFSFSLKFPLNLPQLVTHCSPIIITLLMNLSKNLGDLLEGCPYNVLDVVPVRLAINAAIKFLQFRAVILVLKFEMLAHVLSFF